MAIVNDFGAKNLGGVALRVIDYNEAGQQAPSSPQTQRKISRPPSGIIAAKLLSKLHSSDKRLVYVALGETSARNIAKAVSDLDPDAGVVFLPPWDCLPYDRVAPSRECMGRRMDALRVWGERPSRAKLLVTSLDAMLQRVPPSSIIKDGWFSLAIGQRLDRNAFKEFARRTGYIEEGVVDEPGELAFRDDVIDIFPAGGLAPMRIVLEEDGQISELRSYDPATQRTEKTVEQMVFGPASEAVSPEGALETDLKPKVTSIARQLFQLYGDLETVYDRLEGSSIAFADGTSERLANYLEIIDEARRAHRDLSKSESDPPLYLGRSEWDEKVLAARPFALDLSCAEKSPSFWNRANPRKAFLDYVKDQAAAGRRVLITGRDGRFEALCRRLERGEGKAKIAQVERWSDVDKAEQGMILKLFCDLERGFIDDAFNLVVITTVDVLGEQAGLSKEAPLLAEPEIMPGDVVVHEDHGVGMLSGIENVVTDGAACDAARLVYYGGASVLVPMSEFGKLWRYGSHVGSVSLDRLHTDGWTKKRDTVTRDIQAAARHLVRLARKRRESQATTIVAPRAEYAKFVSRFPFAETTDQAAAVDAIIADLASGTVMNRLVCGDVGFGKTELALRAAAAVALSGGQVVVVSPTTVLARQHFTAFQKRFAGTGIEVAMLSRVVSGEEAKRVKAGLDSGETGIVVATQAILAKDVSFARLQLLIIDEEHRFGARDKARMQALAPLLHTLIMSATPIPRTLQAAMVGVQDVSLLTTAPSKRRPVRTSLATIDPASVRVALLREHRRGGQSFFVAPRIEDLDQLRELLSGIVPELSVRLVHGKMPVATLDEIVVGFADGDGDVLLSTNIIESGLDVPRANTMFIWRADRFGMAQLHQLRGRVGRSKAQGNTFLLVAQGDDISDETRLRLSALVEHDRLGAGLEISIEDLDLRGGGEIAGENQAGHMKVIGVSLYQRLLERAVGAERKDTMVDVSAVVLNLGIAGSIPEEYVNDAAMRLNFYARLLRAASDAEIDGFAEEFEDRFGELPDEVAILLRLAKLKIAAKAFGICQLDGGPRGMAASFFRKPTQKAMRQLSARYAAVQRDERLVFEKTTKTARERLEFFEGLMIGVR